MSKKSAIRFKSFALGAILGVGTITAIAWDDYFEISKNLEIHSILYKELNTFYVDELNPGDLMKTGIDAMLSSLDPYTNYYPESIVEDARFENTGTYGGIGTSFKILEDDVVISETYENAPAQKAGMLPGDILTEVNGKSVKGRKISEVLKLVKGAPGTKVSVKILRDGAAKTIEVTREEIKVKNVPYHDVITEDIGYIKLEGFTADAGKEVREALIELKGKAKLKGVILDLRGNPGGLLREAINVSNVFIDKGKLVVTTKGKNPEWNKTYTTLNPATDKDIPLVVLIDRRSASAAEIVSGTMQDYDRGVVIGNKSFGKGLVQITRPLKYNAQLKVTTSKYYVASGRCIQAIEYSGKNKGEKLPDSLQTKFKTALGRTVYDGAGVMPDIEVADPILHNVTRALIHKNLIFKFANTFQKENASIDAPENFTISDDVYNKFVAFVKKEGLSYETKSEKALTEFISQAEKDKYSTQISAEVKNLKDKLNKQKEDDLLQFKEEIKELLTLEIVQRYYFEKGRTKAAMKFDRDMKKAIEILNTPAQYSKVLSTQWQIPRYESDVDGALFEQEYMREVREDSEE
ncbi:MAG: S41 family peptidase [Flavobacteriales bacterium]|nr:S41 family peptidase [Flavobacteriales bacterium]